MTTGILILLIICLFLAVAFEFVNGFHDTANAVATVIYTNSMKPTTAVVYSGLLNFLGVLTGGIGVAMGIVNLLPMEVLVDTNPYNGIAMIMALLISAIVWNAGTWYFGIPSSSSHTLIGSILGIGLSFYFINGKLDAVNWDKAIDTGWALLISPFGGFALAIVILFIFKRFIKNDSFYKEAVPGQKPPIWIRMILWTTCGTVSFFHGQNDGQKGVGLVMMILIAVMPSYYSLDESVNLQSINANVVSIEKIISATDTSKFGADERKNYNTIIKHSQHYSEAVLSKMHSTDIELKDRFEIRKDVVKITKAAGKLLKNRDNVAITDKEATTLTTEIDNAKKLVEFAPSWVIIMISISLGLGTMIGWKRVVKTIGEKIGKQHMSYAQGASAEIVASIGIGVATAYKVPVSTTHMLSSGIMGSMVAKKGLKNLQKKTVTNIFLAWVLTLPVTIILSGGLFLLFRWLFA